MMHVGDIMSTVEGVQYRGGKSLLLSEYPTVLNTPMVLMISSTCIMIPPTVLKFQRMVSPHGTEHPHGTHDIPPRVQYRGGKSLLLSEYPTVLNTPMVLMISSTCIMIPPQYSNFKGWYPPTVLNTPTVLMISPHVHHDIPHSTEHPHGTQDNPHGTHDIPPRYS